MVLKKFFRIFFHCYPAFFSIFLFLSVGFFFFLSNSLSLAHADTISINPNIPGTTPPTDPAGLIANIYQTALLFGAFLAFGSIVYGGLTYIWSSVPGAKNQAKERIIDALLGLLLLVGAYLLLYVINPALVVFQNPKLSELKDVVEATGTPSQPPTDALCSTPGATGKCIAVPDTADPQCKDLPNEIFEHDTSGNCVVPSSLLACYHGGSSRVVDCKRTTAPPAPSGCSGSASCENSYLKSQYGVSCTPSSAVQKAVACLTANGFHISATTNGSSHSTCSCHYGGSGANCKDGHALDISENTDANLATVKSILQNCSPEIKDVNCGCENVRQKTSCASANHIHCSINRVTDGCGCSSNTF